MSMCIKCGRDSSLAYCENCLADFKSEVNVDRATTWERFAGHALGGLLSDPEVGEKMAVKLACKTADLMLTEKGKRWG